MTKTNQSMRTLWLGCPLVIGLVVAPACASDTEDTNDLEVDDVSEALTQAEYDCEREKRECLIVADCDEGARDVCESAFRACREPARDEASTVRALCRAERDACEAAAVNEAELNACHIAEHECKLPVDPPEAICHVDALRCIWDARTSPPDTDPPPVDRDAEHACREEERACKESLRLDRADLPKAPKCEAPRCGPHGHGHGHAHVPHGSSDLIACERARRECLIAAACDVGLSDACQNAFHVCADPLRDEHERVHALCHAEREDCDAAAADEAARHACHIAEHRCMLPVDPPEAICRIEAHECRWAERITLDEPPAVPPADRACREAEHACVDALRVHPEELPQPPLCAPAPVECVATGG